MSAQKKLAAEEERFHDITVDNESSLYATPCWTVQASPYDNAIAFAAPAGAVPATQAGSGDCTVLGAVNRITVAVP